MLAWLAARSRLRQDTSSSFRNEGTSDTSSQPSSSKVTLDDHENSRDDSRPPIIPAAAVIFVLAFTGASAYGMRAARRAERLEAVEAATISSASKTSQERIARAPSALQRRPQSSPGTTKVDWGNAGSSAPSVLSRSGTGSPSQLANRSVPLPGKPGSKEQLMESPALTAIKAFTIATAIVTAGALLTAEVARRVWKVEDMYDFTDRLHSKVPKSFDTFDRMGHFFRSRLEGLFPVADEDVDPLATPVPQQQESHSLQQHGNDDTLAEASWLDSLRGVVTSPQPSPSSGTTAISSPKPVEELLDEIAEAPTMRSKLELLEHQLRAEKLVQDEHREALRRRREATVVTT